VHPIFSRVERLAAYLAAWLIFGGLLAALFTRLGLDWIGALALLLPLSLVYAFASLSAWYVCRASPLKTSGILRVLTSSGLAALVGGALWVGLARLWIDALLTVPMLAPAAAQYAQQLPLLFAIGVLLFLVALAAHYALMAVEAARDADRQRLGLLVLTRDAELRALRAQVDPHFLYNSLNSISALTSRDPAGARQMCLLLADFLRNTLDVSSRAHIPLRDELALADQFLTIEQVRFGPRLRIERHIDEAAASQCRVPPLILQPLVENAVTHGIAGLLEGGAIRLDVARRNGRLAIVLENPRDVAATPSPRQGLGLENVRQRLWAVFGRAATLETRADVERFTVELDLPWSAHE
jgi:two-component system sensor histidine kinase AlgZ